MKAGIDTRPEFAAFPSNCARARLFDYKRKRKPKPKPKQ
jgi:hypothetical protein